MLQRSTKPWSWVDYLVFVLGIFLLFGLALSSYMELPPLVGWLGRWHPLILHFPIVLILLCVFMSVTDRPVPGALLTLTTLATLVTAISGLLLATAGGVKGPLLLQHQWVGGAAAVGMAVWYWLDRAETKVGWLAKAGQVGLAVLVIIGGHLGGMVTHGENFLDLPDTESTDELPADPLVYQHLVTPILEANCVSCHNPNKQKGELLMNDLAGLQKGGKNGNTLVPGEPEASELIRRLLLPRSDEEHMPPDGKAPLSEREVQILTRWIALGANDTLAVSTLPADEPLVAIVEAMREADPADRFIDLPPVADTTLVNLRNDYLTINRLANGSNALTVKAYLPPQYDSTAIIALGRIAPNIIELDLSGLPLGLGELQMVNRCDRLESLELDQSGLTDTTFATLNQLANLRTLKLYQTAIGDESLEVLASMPALEELYLWDTKVEEARLVAFTEQRPAVRMVTGIDPAVRTFFALSDSTEREEEVEAEDE